MEAELAEYRAQLETVENSYRENPDNTELASLISELKEVIALTETVIAEEKANAEKEAKEKHQQESERGHGARDRTGGGGGRYGKDVGGSGAAGGYDPYSHQQQQQVTYRVGDTVSARWQSGDKAFYPARITSITGSATSPVYIVKFTNYNVSETLTANHIRPLLDPASAGPDSKKRKLGAGDAPLPSPSTAPTSTLPKAHSAVISQPANINNALAEERRKEALGLTGQERKPAKKLKHGKELNEGKKKWLEFASKGIKTSGGVRKKIGESSMFRTPEGIHGRVGFTGSGQPMRKEKGYRGKHIFQEGDDED